MKVLVIEDEHKIANSIQKGLQQENFVVDVAYDGLTGLDLASSESFDAIVLDLMLPGMDGVEICQKLREQHNHTPIIILTAKGELEDKVKGLNTGADDYLTKPFAFAELVARLKALSRRPKVVINPVLTLNNLSLNTDTFEVKRGEAEIALSRKEFSLLEYFLRHPNIVLTKDQIISNVWSYETDILPNTVEVYIGYLRNKIDKPFPNQKSLFQTVRGFGYKISN